MALKMALYILIFFISQLLLADLAPDSSLESEEKNWDAYLELNQMLALNLGTEYHFNARWGVKGAAGLNPLGWATISYNLLGVYHCSQADKRWHFDIEFGMPIAYCNQLEGRYLDQDEIIDDPFAGWIFGGGILVSYNFRRNKFGVRFGGGAWWEHQRDSGWKGPGFIPIVTLVWNY